jgi:fucose permease
VFGQLSASLGALAILRIGLGTAPIAAALLWWNPSTAVSLAGAALLGFALAPVFPTLISVTPQRVGAYFAPQAVGFQVAAANLGIALLPGAVGVLARRYGLEILCVYLVAASVALFALHELAVATTRRGSATYRADTSAAPA